MKDATQFSKNVFKTIDTMKGSAFGSFFTPKGTFIFGNADPVTGPKAIADHCDQFFSMISGLSHHVAQVWQIDNVIITQFVTTYRRKQADDLSFPGVSIWTMEGNKIAEYRIFQDNSPLFAS
jgi:hypothetical protein